MAGGVDVNIGADTREFARAIKSGLVDPVEDAQGKLEEYTRAAGDSGDGAVRAFERQQRSTEELRRDLDDLNTTIRQGSSQAYRSAGQDADTFRRKSSAALDEVKGSARQASIETAASFTGGFDQALGGLQGFAAEMGIAFGPAGIIAGLVAASGLGLLQQQLAGGTEAADTQRQAVADLAQQYIELGRSGVSSADDVRDRITAMATSSDADVIITLQKAWEAARLSGANYAQVVEAIGSASPAAIDKAQRAVAQVSLQQQRAAQTAADAGSAQYRAGVQGAEGALKLSEALDKAKTQAEEAGRAQRLAARAGLSELQLKADLMHQLEDSYDDAASSVDDYIDTEKGTFDTGAYVKAMRRRQRALEDYHDTLAQSDLSPAAVKFLEGQGAETAAAMLKGYRAAGPKRQAELQAIWTTAGRENATDYQDAIGKSLQGKTFRAPKIEVPYVPAPNTAALDRYLSQPKYLRVVVDAYTRDGKRIG